MEAVAGKKVMVVPQSTLIQGIGRPGQPQADAPKLSDSGASVLSLEISTEAALGLEETPLEMTNAIAALAGEVATASGVKVNGVIVKPPPKETGSAAD